MLKDCLLAAGISFAAALCIGPVVIPMLRRLKIGQTVRDDGPETHLKKSGTPTMGGVIFLVGIVLGALPFAGKYPGIVPVLFLSFAFGVIGFIDDFIKVVLKRSKGLAAWQKLSLQIIVTAGFAYYLHISQVSHQLRIPFTEQMVDPGILGLPILFFVVLGTDTGTNFTDGLDGLASSVTVAVALFFTAASFILKEEGTAAPLAAAVCGGLLAFLVFNAYPAKVFMGDTGALALGGFVSGMAYLMHLQLYIPIFGIIYLVEVVSVILQVTYFKLTHGKRIFRMAPIHHHFEKGGYTEVRIVILFTLVTVMACLLSLGGLL